MQKILIVGVSFNDIGGVEIAALNLCTAFRARKINCKILVEEIKRGNISSKFPNIDVNNFFEFVPLSESGNLYYLKYVSKLSKNSNLVVIGFWNVVNVLLCFCRTLKRFKLVCVEHADYENCPKKWYFLRKFAYRFADRVVSLTSFDACKYVKLNKNVEIIPNFFKPPKHLMSEEKDNTILFVGHLTKLKRPDLLISAAAIISNLIKGEWKIKFIGVGKERGSLENQIVRSGLAEDVEFLGYVSDMESEYSRARILVSCSESECLPMNIIESKFFQIVPVASEYSPAVYDLITPYETGMIFKKGDEIDLAKKLAAVIQKYEKNEKDMLEKIRVDSINFSERLIINKWTNLLASI
ncbi:glycosyltransferase [Thalassotalea sp. Y01]|uniref:glycosyltransferase n=1 Tax=Thalassotalea sp. Y01 TaxID=2729613 RepID=UPI00145C695D|nr:glycosyltransferase [Thalassotalea sp. Y01]NMP16512.1 glycosyltransferase family 4 protein [Thalassotalea sp. Y01]